MECEKNQNQKKERDLEASYELQTEPVDVQFYKSQLQRTSRNEA